MQELEDVIAAFDADACAINAVYFQPGQVHKGRALWELLWKSPCRLGVVANYAFDAAFLSKSRRFLKSALPTLSTAVGRVDPGLHARSWPHAQMIARALNVPDSELVRSSEYFRPIDHLWTIPGLRTCSPRLVDSRTQVRGLRSDDADLCLGIGTAAELPHEPFFVFIDSMNGHLHPDFIHYGHDGQRLVDRYYEDLTRVLKQYEQAFSVKCLVAPHPKNTPETLTRYLGAFDCADVNTATLVRDAAFVAAEPSNALALCAWWNKPAVLITSQHLPRAVLRIGRFFSRSLGLPVVVLEQLSGELPRPKIDKLRADRFVSHYMQPPGVQDVPNAAIIAASLA